MPKKHIVHVENAVVTEESPIYNKSEVLVKIQSQYPARLLYTGSVSGQPYEWRQSGDVVSVREEDVFELLSKRIGSRSCCGGSNADGNVVFKLFIE